MKNKLKITGAFLLLAFISFNISAQNKAGKTDDLGRIVLNPYIFDQAEPIPSSAEKMLLNKLGQIATANGIGGSALNPRFLITPDVSVLTKDLTATAPPMTALTLEVTIYIGDGYEGTLFSSESFEVKGVGTNETKAYIAALKQIKPKNPQIQACVDQGKLEIVEYYNSRCDFIIKEAQALESQNEFEEAMLLLSSVPEVCKECFDKCMDAVAPIFQKQIDRECEMKIAEAQNSWNAGQNREAANAASQHLVGIEPQAACYDEARGLAEEIAARIQALDQRAWEFQMQEYNDKVEMRKSMIEAVRQIGVTHASNRPKKVVEYRRFR